VHSSNPATHCDPARPFYLQAFRALRCLGTFLSLLGVELKPIALFEGPALNHEMVQELRHQDLSPSLVLCVSGRSQICKPHL
jgi:hypothetical protein